MNLSTLFLNLEKAVSIGNYFIEKIMSLLNSFSNNTKIGQYLTSFIFQHIHNLKSRLLSPGDEYSNFCFYCKKLNLVNIIIGSSCSSHIEIKLCFKKVDIDLIIDKHSKNCESNVNSFKGNNSPTKDYNSKEFCHRVSERCKLNSIECIEEFERFVGKNFCICSLSKKFQKERDIIHDNDQFKSSTIDNASFLQERKSLLMDEQQFSLFFEYLSSSVRKKYSQNLISVDSMNQFYGLYKVAKKHTVPSDLKKKELFDKYSAMNSLEAKIFYIKKFDDLFGDDNAENLSSYPELNNDSEINFDCTIIAKQPHTGHLMTRQETEDTLESDFMRKLFKLSSDGDIEGLLRFEKDLTDSPDISKINKCMTPLHLAADRGEVQVIKILLNMGFNVNAQDEDGDTSLNLAVVAERLEIVRILLNHGAIVDIKNSSGEDSKQLALNCDDKNILKELVNSTIYKEIVGEHHEPD